MVLVNGLQAFGKFKFIDGTGCDLENIKNIIENVADEQGIPVSVYRDQASSGGFFNKTYEDCLVLVHPEHTSDYFSFCIRVSSQGKMAFVMVDTFGTSKQMEKASYANAAAESGFSGDLGGLISLGVRSIGRNKQALEDEQNYYDAVGYVLETAFQG